VNSLPKTVTRQRRGCDLNPGLLRLRLHSFMSLNVLFKVTIVAEFLLTNVTREPSTFIV